MSGQIEPDLGAGLAGELRAQQVRCFDDPVRAGLSREVDALVLTAVPGEAGMRARGEISDEIDD